MLKTGMNVVAPSRFAWGYFVMTDEKARPVAAPYGAFG